MKSFILSVFGVHSEEDRVKAGSRCGAVNIIFNIILFVIKLIGGIISGSVSVTADALNNLSDTSASIVGLIGFHISGAKADREHPFGHARAEYLSALCVAVLILLLGAELLKSSVEKIIHPSPVSFTPVVFAVLVISIIVKLIMFFYNRLLGKAIDSSLLEATSKDSLNDFFTTLGVLAGGIAACFTDINPDGFIGCAVAIFILYGGINLIKETSDPLLGAAPDPKLVNSIEEKILSYPNIFGTHDLIIHDYGPNRRFASVHVEMPANLTIIACHDVIDAMERDFLSDYGINLIVHLDPVSDGGELRETICRIAKSIDKGCTIHDLRISGSTLFFDCVKPETCALSDSAVADIFQTEIKAFDPSLTAAVTVDSGFAPVQNYGEAHN